MSTPKVSGPLFDEEFLSQYEELDQPGEPRLIQQLVNRCLISGPERLQAIREAIDRRDSDGIRHEAHAPKGIVANLGAVTLVKRCHVLELQGEMNLRENIDGAYQALVSEYLEVSEELKRRFL